MKNKSLICIGVFGIVDIIGSKLLWEVDTILLPSQRVGFLMMVLGTLLMGISYGWLLRSEQPDLKPKEASKNINTETS